MSDDNKCTCCTCGFEWKRGRDGGHSCTETMEKTICELKAALKGIKDWDINNKMKQGQFLLGTPIRSKLQKLLAE